MQDGDQPQGEFDGSGNASWGEADWAGYLHRNDLEVGRFLSYYNEVKKFPDRLDASARRMGWESADWAPGESEELAEDEENPDLPYCIHQHPVYIVARALGIQLIGAWRTICRENPAEIGGELGADLMLAFWDAQHQVVMAINATDTGDLPLALVHLKRALSSINHAIGYQAALPPSARLNSVEATQDLEATLFDLREICLRVMADCRWDGSKN